MLVSAATSLAVHVLPPDYSNFLVTLTIVDEFCYTNRQAVMATTVALRTLTLETQMRGKLHAPGWLCLSASSTSRDLASPEYRVRGREDVRGQQRGRRQGRARHAGLDRRLVPPHRGARLR